MTSSLILAIACDARTRWDEAIAVFNLSDKLDAAVNQMTVPDLWQHEAISALRAGRDVVVHAPTGAGKTLIFELWTNHGKNHGQAIYTVPTRALANDKLAEWRAKGWNVGISTGDLSDNLSAPVLVATLETQKNRLIRGEGPTLLVVDEYQMLGDADRGLNYELAIALAPPKTQLLLLSGSVANPHDVVKWLTRLGRRAVLVRHDQRPVPLEEVMMDHLHFHLPSEVKTYWPKLVAKALMEGLGPVLIFAPRRQGAESIAAELARQLPNPHPLELTDSQKQLLPDDLQTMLRSRVAFHHSGLSYAARAGIIEPLAKAGQLRAVVATMGLAAGINFSLRSVALAGNSYRKEGVEVPIRPDEILQMFGRAGRRGIDDIGYILVGSQGIRQHEGYACQLARSGLVDWSAILGLMQSAADNQQDPFEVAVRVQTRLFTTKPIVLGVEQSMKFPSAPCGLRTDAERARHARSQSKELLNSKNQWQPIPQFQHIECGTAWTRRTTKSVSKQSSNLQQNHHLRTGEDLLGRSVEPKSDRMSQHSESTNEEIDSNKEWDAGKDYVALLQQPKVLETLGLGPVRELEDSNGFQPGVFGQLCALADELADGRLVLMKQIRKLLNWPTRVVSASEWESSVLPSLRELMKQVGKPIVRVGKKGHQIQAVLDLAQTRVQGVVDVYGQALHEPITRSHAPHECVACLEFTQCKELPTATGVALLWRRLGLIDTQGKPSRRGRLVSFFHQADGLAIAACLEDEPYPLQELVYDLANLDAGFRFAGDENRWGGRLVEACRKVYGLQRIPGYLEDGIPLGYGAGASEIAAALHKNSANKYRWLTVYLGAGDIDRAIIEWRSLLRQIVHAPQLDWGRWTALQMLAKSILNETESPTITNLPPLPYLQTKRLDHKLHLKR